MLKDSIDNGPYQLKPEITVKDTNRVTDIHRPQRVEDLVGQEKLRYDSDIKVVNILLLGLLVDIYTLINHYQTEKEIWDSAKELMEAWRINPPYYLRYAKLINDMKMIPMSMTPMQLNTKFFNHLQPEWSRFVTPAKQERDLHNVNFDQLYAFLKHNEKMLKKFEKCDNDSRNHLLCWQIPTTHILHTASPPLQSYASSVVPQQPPSIQLDSIFVVPTFLATEDPIASHIANTAKKRVKDSEWFKEKMLLAQAQKAGVVYDSDYDDEATTSAIFMANLSPVGSINDDTVESRYDSDILSELPYYDTYHDSDMLNSNIQELGYIENIVPNNESYDELTSYNNVISYTNYMLIIGNYDDNCVPPPILKNDMILSVIEQMISQVDKCNMDRRSVRSYDQDRDFDNLGCEQSDIKGAFKKDVLPFPKNPKETFKLFEKGFIAEKIEDENVSLAFHVSSLVKEQEHIKLEYKNLYDSIKQTRAKTKLKTDSLKQKLNDQIYEINKLRAQLKVKFSESQVNQNVIPKVIENNDLSKSVTSHLTTNKIIEKFTKVLTPGLLKTQFEPINAYFKNNRAVYRDYLKDTKEHVATLQELLNQARALKLLDEHIGYASKFAARIHELLVYETASCPFTQSGNKKWAPATNHKKNNKPYVDASRTKQTIEKITQKHAVKQNTQNTNNTILPFIRRVRSTNASGSQPKSNTKNDRIQRTSNCNANVKNVALSKNSDTIFLSCNECLFSAIMMLDLDGNQQEGCLIWKKIIQTSPATIVPPRNRLHTIRIPTVAPSTETIMRYSIVKNSLLKAIMGYGDLQMGNILISRVYYVEGLGHNLFSVGQFCDSDLEVAFRKHTCFVRNLDGVDLLLGSRGSNLYTMSMADMMKSSPVYLLSKASKTKAWLWHRRLSHLNFETINQLAKQGLVKGLSKLKYIKYHLCSACQMGKSKKESYPHKPEPSTNEKLQMLYMDLYGPMRVESINKKRYILVIVDDYSRFTWVKFLRTKDEASEIIIKFLKQA
ncbi:retrovirus-related pol polyprotein from transposon TNT 1-94 [Tanacetum coccineum]